MVQWRASQMAGFRWVYFILGFYLHIGGLQARTQDFLTGGYKVLKSPSQPNAARGSGGAQ